MWHHTLLSVELTCGVQCMGSDHVRVAHVKQAQARQANDMRTTPPAVTPFPPANISSNTILASNPAPYACQSAEAWTASTRCRKPGYGRSHHHPVRPYAAAGERLAALRLDDTATQHGSGVHAAGALLFMANDLVSSRKRGSAVKEAFFSSGVFLATLVM